MMRLFKLTAIKSESPIWRRSSYRGEVIVRAESEGKARKAAAVGLALMAPAGTYTEYSPWNDATESTCTECADTTFPVEGPSGVLTGVEG